MALKDFNSELNRKRDYVKLSQFKDGETITVNDAVILYGKYGDQPCFINDTQYITLPSRYCSFIDNLIDDSDAMRELHAGAQIIKQSYETSVGNVTPTFEFC